MREFIASMVFLGVLILVSVGFAISINNYGPVAPEVARFSAADWFMAHEVPLPPHTQRGVAVAGPVFFVEQDGVDALCGGKNHVIACAQIGGTAMALPNPCQPRFAGEAYAALVCHEKGHILGWKHDG